MPSVGLRAREAMPVLNRIEGMSTMAEPVVSEPVPAVVGTRAEALVSVFCRFLTHHSSTPASLAMSGLRVPVTAMPLPIGALM